MARSIAVPTKTISSPKPRRIRLHWQALVPFVTFLVVLAVWEIAARYSGLPAYLLPAPGRVAEKFWRVLMDGTLLRHAAVTLGEVLSGLALGMVVATTLGYLLAKSVIIERAIGPYLVATQAVPIVAIAPLLVIWFGSGMTSKVLICALIILPSILINTIAGLRSVPADLHDLMRSLRATRWQTFVKLEAPAALPVLLAGLKIGANLSVIGAVVGEFAGSNAGLGYMVSIANGQYDTARMLVGIFVLITMALALYGIVGWMENRALRYLAADQSG